MSSFGLPLFTQSARSHRFALGHIIPKTEDVDNKVTLLFFAKSRELSGLKTSQIFSPTRVNFQQLLDIILTAFPGLGVISENIVLSLNEDYIEKESTVDLHTGDEIAVIPPISGGMDHVEITESVLDVNHVTDLVTSPSCGAISVFIGTTRDNFNGKKVIRLEYEAYTSMAEKKMSEICQLIRQKWDVHKIAMVHRIGVVLLTESSIIIAISSPHRKESLEAVHYAIDTLKATVPIWKKEIYEDESSTWKENKECTWSESNSK